MNPTPVTTTSSAPGERTHAASKHTDAEKKRCGADFERLLRSKGGWSDAGETDDGENGDRTARERAHRAPSSEIDSTLARPADLRQRRGRRRITVSASPAAPGVAPSSPKRGHWLSAT